MATPAKGKKKPAKKGSSKTPSKGGKAMVVGDPIIITGGSIMVDFNPDFDDDDAAPSPGHKKIRRIRHPIVARKIRGLEVRDGSGNLILAYVLPSELNGECEIRIQAR